MGSSTWEWDASLLTLSKIQSPTEARQSPMSAVLSIAAVVATHNRPELLGQHALASIALQTRQPDYLVVVDDSSLDTRRTNFEIVAQLDLPEVQITYLENRRTQGPPALGTQPLQSAGYRPGCICCPSGRR